MIALLSSIITAIVVALGGTIYEDSPLWDCRIHGNQQCGPGATVYGIPVDHLGEK